MQMKQQRRIDSLRRILDYLVIYAEKLGSIATSEPATQLSISIATAESLGNEQGSAQRRIFGQFSRESAITRELRVVHMQPIITFAKARLHGVPDIAALTPSPRNLLGPHLVRAARTMATAAAPYAEVLTQGGFPHDALAQLGAAADALEAAWLDRGNTRVDRAKSTHGIKCALDSGAEAVSILNALVTRQFAKDPTFLAGWNIARRVHAKPGTLRAGVASETPEHTAAA
ncbi:MAG: hypothetical protein V4550_04120 [Gemmatimonadota bacterium]